MIKPALWHILAQACNAFAAEGIWYLSISRDRILALTGGNKLQHPKPSETNGSHWLQGGIFTICLSNLYTFFFWDLEPHRKKTHSWMTDTVSPLTYSVWYNLFEAQTFGLCFSQPPVYQLPPTCKISIYGTESSKMEAGLTIYFLFSVCLICQALKFGKLLFKTELKIQYCTLYSRKYIYP